MRRSVLVAQASRRGPANRVGELVAEVLASHGLAVDVLPAAQVGGGLDRYGAIVVGGPTRLGRWHRDARRFLHRHRGALGGLPVALFATDQETASRHDGAIERALAEAPEVDPVLRACFPIASRMPAHADPDEVKHWAEDLARELGA